MTKIIKLNFKKSIRKILNKSSFYHHYRFVIRAMSKRGLVVADSYVRTRYGLDLLSILIACKTLLRPTDSQHFSTVSLNFLNAHAVNIFNECTKREEVLCKLYELKQSISNAMQYQLQFSGMINEKVATTRGLERIIDSAIFTINCLDSHFINSNSLTLKEAFNLLNYDNKSLAILSTEQLKKLVTLLLWRSAMTAEQTILGKKLIDFKAAIARINIYIKSIPNHPPMELIRSVLINSYPPNSNEHIRLKKMLFAFEKSQRKPMQSGFMLAEKNEAIAA